MPIDPAYRAEIIAQADALSSNGVNAPGLYVAILDARKGVAGAFERVERVVSSYRAAQESGGRSPAAGPGGMPGAVRFAPSAPIPPGSETDAALSRAFSLPLRSFPRLEAFEDAVFEGIEAARDHRGTASFSDTTLGKQVRGILAMRLAERLTTLPYAQAPSWRQTPVPGSGTFPSFLRARFGISVEQAQNWQASPLWRMALSLAFHRLMGESVALRPRDVPIETRLAEVQWRRMWFGGLVSAGVSEEEIALIFAQSVGRDRRDHPFTAAAWLHTFAPSPSLAGPGRERRMQLLAREIESLHRDFPLLDAESFFHILTPFAGTTDAGVIAAAMTGEGIDRFHIFRTRTILLWHSADHEALGKWLLPIIDKNRRYATLGEFCSVLFATTEDGLRNRLAAMRDAGTDVMRLVRAIRRKFPQARFSLPRESGTPWMRPPALSTAGGAVEFGGLRVAGSAPAAEAGPEDEGGAPAPALPPVGTPLADPVQLFLPFPAGTGTIVP